MVQLVLNAMKLQQCRPGFFEARDAIIRADQVLTGGENFCDLWLAFVEKGSHPALPHPTTKQSHVPSVSASIFGKFFPF
jgi:hypothetical protein